MLPARARPSGAQCRRELHDGLRRLGLEGDLVNCCEQGQPLAEAVLLHHRPDLLRRERALELLAAQELLLDLIPGLGAGPAHKGLCTLAVAAAEACGDEVRDAAALEEGAVLDSRVEVPDEGGHLLKADADHCGLRVAAVVQAVAEARAQRHDVLQRPAQLHARDVVHGPDAEVRAVEELHERGLVLGRSVGAQGGLTELALRDLVGDVGAHEHRDVVVQELPENVRAETQLAAFELQATLDEAHGHGTWLWLAHALHGLGHELVRQNPDHHIGVGHRLLHVRLRTDVGGQLDAWEVLDVLLGLVEDLGELPLDPAVLDLLLEHPHRDLVVELAVLGSVACNDLRDGASPVAAADDGHLLRACTHLD
mmetsp:Transcript_32681/g.103636  ORF Transcript_32681/g.103636 Transcript_32681/m.103636 type:complete len:367 (-) Transcript_32681:71-1171(-)